MDVNVDDYDDIYSLNNTVINTDIIIIIIIIIVVVVICVPLLVGLS